MIWNFLCYIFKFLLADIQIRCKDLQSENFETIMKYLLFVVHMFGIVHWRFFVSMVVVFLPVMGMLSFLTINAKN